MSTAQAKPVELAEDGLPKVDVIELATMLLHPGHGPRKQTMVSMREARAMAEALIQLNQLGAEAAGLIFLLGRLGDATPDERRLLTEKAGVQATKVQKLLVTIGYAEGDDAQS